MVTTGLTNINGSYLVRIIIWIKRHLFGKCIPVLEYV